MRQAQFEKQVLVQAGQQVQAAGTDAAGLASIVKCQSKRA